ncbi:MAG: hypothetical protein MK198_07525 [Gracilimonas sp.]|uniref:hypothetical protein n=1 Tax=Gracilimonas sp. TaxID=1974203 RepID=UPI003750B133|nr:hypothetical protein [Gracilimonas sp.]
MRKHENKSTRETSGSLNRKAEDPDAHQVIIPIEEAKEFLSNHFEQIPSVEIWGEMMGYKTRQSFWHKFDTCFDESPQKVYIRVKK